MPKSFEDFLDETTACDDYGIFGTKICRCDGGLTSIAKDHINITRIFPEKVSGKGIELYVEFESAKQKRRIRDSVLVNMSYMGKITFDLNELFDIIQFTIKNGYKNEVLGLYKKYFSFCITAYIKSHPAFLAKCGWIPGQTSRIFLPVTLPEDAFPEDNYLKMEKDLFNGLFRKRTLRNEAFETSFENLCSQNDCFEKLLSFLMSDPCALIVFSYSIHSVLWDYLTYYRISNIGMKEIPNEDLAIFSLCIYGKDPATSKIIANLLANFFTITDRRWATVSGNGHISSTSLSQKKFDDLVQYKSVPIIITSRTNRFTKTSGIVKRLHQKRENSWFHCYPVYISSSPIMVDEMVNSCSDSMIEILNHTDNDAFAEIHRQFCYIIYQFILYLIRIEDRERCLDSTDEYYLKLNRHELIKKIDFTEEWLDNHVPEFLLYSTMDCFCHYLESTPLRSYADKLRAFSEICFLSDKQKEEKAESTGNARQETEYLRFLYLFIQKYLKPKNESWIWKGQETRGDKEVCYYLTSEGGYEEFKKFLTKKSSSDISKEKFNGILKKYEVLKMPKSGNSNTMKRKNKYVLVLKKDKLDHYADQTST